ncbi:MAG: hypothetical protein ACKO6N_15235 [Myxococcota bacterium]
MSLLERLLPLSLELSWSRGLHGRRVYVGEGVRSRACVRAYLPERLRSRACLPARACVRLRQGVWGWILSFCLSICGLLEPAELVAQTSGRSSSAVILDRIVVVVNGQPLTRSRLLLFERVLRLYDGNPGWPVREATSLQTPAELEQWAILEELLYEASSAGSGVRLSRTVVEQELERLKAQWGGDVGWSSVLEKLSMSEELLRERVARRLRIQAYVLVRLGTVRISEKEAQEYFETLRPELLGLTEEEGRSLALQRLKVERQRALFLRWADELRERATIQVPSREVLP